MEQFPEAIYEDVPPQYVTKFCNAAVKNLYSLDKSKLDAANQKLKSVWPLFCGKASFVSLVDESELSLLHKLPWIRLE